MDLLEFAAFGGLERIAIIAGALLVGYWGYRLYVAGKTAGLAFLGVACAMLFGALLTGGSHVRSVGEGIQLASAGAANPTDAHAGTESTTATENRVVAQASPAGTDLQLPGASVTAGAPDTSAASAADIRPSGPLAASDEPTKAAESNNVEPVDAESIERPADNASDDPGADELADTRKRLATAQELGGRILSVKSDHVSLEWSPASRDR